MNRGCFTFQDPEGLLHAGGTYLRCHPQQHQEYLFGSGYQHVAAQRSETCSAGREELKMVCKRDGHLVIVLEVSPQCMHGWIEGRGGRAAIDNNRALEGSPTSPQGIKQLSA
jgi:hypothetical protein